MFNPAGVGDAPGRGSVGFGSGSLVPEGGAGDGVFVFNWRDGVGKGTVAAGELLLAFRFEFEFSWALAFTFALRSSGVGATSLFAFPLELAFALTTWFVAAPPEIIPSSALPVGGGDGSTARLFGSVVRVGSDRFVFAVFDLPVNA